jgi:guanine deaminase
VTCALGTDVGGGLGFGILKEGLQAYLMQRLAPDPQKLDPVCLLYLSTLAGADALGLSDEIGDFQSGKSADFIHVRPPAGSVLEAAVRRAESAVQTLGTLFTMAGAESVVEVRVGGDVVFPTV